MPFFYFRDISPPASVVQDMQLQAAAERQKRARILESQGHRQADINVAEGKKQSAVLLSEANRLEQINAAHGQAEAIVATAEATAKGIERLASAIQLPGGREAVSLRVAEQYVEALGNVARSGNTLILPANMGDVSGMVATALQTFQTISARGTQQAIAAPSAYSAAAAASSSPPPSPSPSPPPAPAVSSRSSSSK